MRRMDTSSGRSIPAAHPQIQSIEQRPPSHVQGAVKLFLWSLFSSGTIFLNKRLYTTAGFPFPLASTAVGQLTTALGGYMLIVFGVFPRKPLPHPSQALKQLVPAALATSGTLFAGNYAYLTLSIAFMQVLCPAILPSPHTLSMSLPWLVAKLQFYAFMSCS